MKSGRPSVVFFYFLSTVFAVAAALAVETAKGENVAAASSASVASMPQKTRFGLSTEHWVHGATFRDVDGASTQGSNLNIVTMVRFDTIFRDGWRLRLAPGFALSTKQKQFSRTSLDHFEVEDPYAAVINSSILSGLNGTFNMAVEGRLYAPLSRNARLSSGGTRDRADGKMMLRHFTTQELGPHFRLMLDHRMVRNFAKTSQNPDNMVYEGEFYNYLVWKLSDSFQPFVAYNNYPEGYRSGDWAAFSRYHYIEAGFAWFPTEKIMIAPFVETPMHLKDTKIQMLSMVTWF